VDKLCARDSADTERKNRRGKNTSLKRDKLGVCADDVVGALALAM